MASAITPENFKRRNITPSGSGAPGDPVKPSQENSEGKRSGGSRKCGSRIIFKWDVHKP